MRGPSQLSTHLYSQLTPLIYMLPQAGWVWAPKLIFFPGAGNPRYATAFVGVLGLWVCLGYRGCAWVIVGVLGLSWVCLGYRGCAWVVVGVLGLSWVCLGCRGCAWVIVNNIVSLATQLSQNKKKFLGKVIVYVFIPQSFVLPSVYKIFLQTKTQTL